MTISRQLALYFATSSCRSRQWDQGSGCFPPCHVRAQCIASPDARCPNNAVGDLDYSRGGRECIGPYATDMSNPPPGRKAGTIRTFGLWILAHYTERSDDCVHVANHGGLKVKQDAHGSWCSRGSWCCVRTSMLRGYACACCVVTIDTCCSHRGWQS